MKILVDMDDVIADFEGEFIKRYKQTHPDKYVIELQDRRGWWMIEQYPEELKPYVREIYRAPGFCENLPLVEGCLQAMNEMSQTAGVEVYICSSPLFTAYENCVLEKFHWVRKSLGADWVNKLILTYDKTVVKGDYLIDDNPEITGAVKPEWEHIVFDRPYNRDSKTEKRMTWINWKEVLGL